MLRSFYGQTIFHIVQIDHVLFTHSSAHGYCVHFLPIVNGAAMNIHGQVLFLSTCFQFCWSKYLGMELLLSSINLEVGLLAHVVILFDLLMNSAAFAWTPLLKPFPFIASRSVPKPFRCLETSNSSPICKKTTSNPSGLQTARLGWSWHAGLNLLHLS